ncbi:hypothetical protein HpCOL24_11470 [Helicobacter pylori]|uniref:hypothetical protein n=1 Tax=Helicobacter pylori TaxID=210 RepID=UPI000991F900|nr:hypothetical protein [Helicobacter pylori]MBM0608468.1 hypothetical protein [Helicobacter pylori]MBS3012041.1 hypothetical protein [Helicobacter pylori]MBS3013698.1 hypothetical protein [Helicobacter pylori]NGP14800.1 hypothetical protein [Helicobacter pylori]OOP76169.1 hypothetical protein B0X29_05955 [Helicobacter pylori]
MRIFKSFKKVFSKPAKLYQRAVLGLGVMFATNQYLMAAIDPMAGISSLESFAKKAISVVALIVGIILLVKSIWDLNKAHNDFKTGQRDFFSYVIPAPMLVGALFLIYFGFWF